MNTYRIQFVECITYEMELDAPNEQSALSLATAEWVEHGSGICRFIDCDAERWRVIRDRS